MESPADRPDTKSWHLPPIGTLVTLLSGEVTSRALSFVAIAVLTRRLGPEGWAPVAMALTMLQFGTLFVESGLRLYGAREVAREHANGARLMGPILSSQLVLGALAVAGALLVWGLGLAAPELAVLLPGYAVSLLLLPLLVPWVFQGYGDMRWVALPQVLRYAILLVLAVLVVTSPGRAVMLPWLEIASMAAAAALALVALEREYGLRARPARLGAIDLEVLRESAPIAGTQMLWVVRMYLPTLVLWWLASREAVATFDVSLRILMVLQAFLTMYMMNLYTPLSQAAHGDGRRFRGLLATSTVIAGVLAAAGALVLNVAPGRLLALLFGGSYGTPDAAASLAILAFVIAVLAVRAHALFALVALGRQRRELLCSVSGSVLLLVLLLAWVPETGARGAALAMLVSESFGLLVTWAALLWVLRAAGAARLPARAGTTAP